MLSDRDIGMNEGTENNRRNTVVWKKGLFFENPDEICWHLSRWPMHFLRGSASLPWASAAPPVLVRRMRTVDPKPLASPERLCRWLKEFIEVETLQGQSKGPFKWWVCLHLVDFGVSYDSVDF